ncbi:MAG: hypothetical protein ACXWDL_00120 [Nocardioides sp.]
MTKSTHALTATATALLAVLLLGGCGDPDETTATDEPTKDTMSSTSPSVPGAQSPQARAATADLASRLDVGQDEIAVVAVEAVTWRDGSLGCAEPGMMYTQALVDGHRIRLAVGTEEYEYHDGGQRGPFLCEDPTQ